MSLWVGIDDTDSPRGGCTTFVLTELIALARDEGLDLIGEPRLVRLNPNIPWKTRGNAALAAHFGRGRGPARRVGEVGGRPVRAFARSGPVPPPVEENFLGRAWELVRARSDHGAEGTDPAMVAVQRPLPSALYRAAVQEVVRVSPLKRRLDAARAWYRTEGTDRGLVGASAALAWPGRRSTWEAIAYRQSSRYGTPREVDPASVREAQRREPRLFLCFDERTRRMMVAPHTPCPILYGLRGTSFEAPMRARRWVRSEPVDRWMLFRTNQGSGDHLVPRPLGPWRPHVSGWVRGVVKDLPVRLAGGHVRFVLADRRGGQTECVAFEPTKTLPGVARELVPGDRLRVWGSGGRDPGLRVEGLEVLRWSRVRPERRPPTCPACGRSAHSRGRLRGYQCPRCHRTWPPEAARPVVRPPPRPVGTYHPTPSARRHLAPLAAEE